MTPQRPRRRSAAVVGVTALAVALPSAAMTAPAAVAAEQRHRPAVTQQAVPTVVGHRGASGYRPEHTLASYELAARTGADYIEPDLVATKDGVLVARHENEISGTTDIAKRPEFADRRTTKVVDGVSLTGWFTEDLTLAELRSLRAVERIPEVRPRNTAWDGRYQVPTFDEVLALRARLSRELRRPVGVYPETKHPTYFRSIGLPLEEPLVRSLRKHGLDRRGAPVHVQSFELANLVRMREDLGLKARSVFLTSRTGGPYADDRTYAELLTPASLRTISRWVDGIGPEQRQVVPWNADGTLGTPTSLVADAHAAGLRVHPYTVRAENFFLPASLDSSADPTAYGRVDKLFAALLEAGVDGYFTDQPDLGVLARDRYVEERATARHAA